MDQPSARIVGDNIITDKEATNVTEAALESDKHINVHQRVGHKVTTQLKVTGG
jgi:hypothetical protein